MKVLKTKSASLVICEHIILKGYEKSKRGSSQILHKFSINCSLCSKEHHLDEVAR